MNTVIGMPHVKRLVEIDALRGLAALAVMAFHYTFKFDEVYGFTSGAPFMVSWGYLGVNLFFVISGFVIFMTLEKTRAPMDFIVSRTSRLYPAYWTAIVLTVAVTHVLGLPGKEVSVGVALLNFLMFQQLFSVPPVDSAYWTLLVELLFYCLAFLLFLTRSMHRINWALCILLGLRLIYWMAATFAGIDLPWRISQLLILDQIPFFALGIAAFRLITGSRERAGSAAVAAFSIAVLAVAESLMLAGVGLACFLLVAFAAAGKLPILRSRVLQWLGMISYPLYLLHENIGWAILRQLQLIGWSATPSLLVTSLLMFALATAVCLGIERPAMGAIRRWYKSTRTYQMAHNPR